MPHVTPETLLTSDASDRRPLPHPSIAKYIPAGWPDEATLAYYVPIVTELMVRLAVAEQRLAAKNTELIHVGAAGG